MSKHLVLVGLNYQNKRISGDKNYWFDIVPYLAPHLKRITILSIRRNIVPEENLSFSGCKVVIRFLSTAILYPLDTHKNKLCKHGAFSSWLGVLEKTLSIIKLAKALIKLKMEDRYQYVHLMDNMGIVNSIIQRIAGVPVTVSAMSYQGKKPKWLYHTYLKLSYSMSSNVRIVAYSEAIKRKFENIGIRSEKIFVIPWGVNARKEYATRDDNKEIIRKELGIDAACTLILWSGYIQQISRKDFIFAYEVARKVLKIKDNKVVFLFAFKPESYESEFLKGFSQDNNLIIRKTSKEEFDRLTTCADIFFSPVTNSNCVIAPPLTWIEMLNNGVPIITTSVAGAETIIDSGQTGFMSWNENELCKYIIDFKLLNKGKMCQKCLDSVRQNFNVEKSAEKYLSLFEKLNSRSDK